MIWLFYVYQPIEIVLKLSLAQMISDGFWELFSLHYLYFTQQFIILFDFKMYLFLPFAFKYTLLK